MKTNVNQKEFQQIKTLHDMGLTEKQIFKISERSKTTIHRMMETSTLEDYLDLQRSLSPSAIRAKNNISSLQIQEPIGSNQVLINLIDAIVAMTAQWKSMEEKLDEVLETKRPWFNKAR